MPNFDIIKEVKPKKSFRIASVMGKFDLQSEHIKENFKGEIDLKQDWQIGLIVGNSGTGKSIIAKELFPNEYIYKHKYKADSILDDFPQNLSITEITQLFNSVGFSSPPSWLKPYSVLSNGEKMRVDLARSIAEKKDLIVFDEFTSVVDRNVAKIGSAAISKAIRRTNKKFIAVTCHYDVKEWLEPDWIFDTNGMNFEYIRGRLWRPKIELKIYEQKGMWNLFRKYHYLNFDIFKSAKQFVAFINNNPVAFCGVLHFPHPKVKNVKKCTRLVVLPDYQGLGIGGKLLEFVAEMFVKQKFKFRITTSTPALINTFKYSKKWKCLAQGRMNRASNHSQLPQFRKTSSYKRITTTWEFVHVA